MADKAGADLRAELGALSGVDASASRILGEALMARAKIYATWGERCQRAGRRLPLPTKLDIDLARVEREVAPYAERGEVEELKRRQKELDSPEVVRTYEALSDALAFSIEGHEAQHRLDLLRPIPVPRAVDRYAPPLDRPAQNRLPRQIAAELSAYLAQIARDDAMPRVTYTRLAKFATDPAVRGGAESYVALLATEAITRELAAPDVGPLLHDGSVDEERMARAHRAIAAVPAPAPCAAAARAWQASFGAPLPKLTFVNVEATP